MKIVILGCGFVGIRAARLFAGEGHDVVGVTHSAESAAKLVAEPIRALACDISDRAAMERMPWGEVDAVVHCASSGGGGAEGYRRVYLDGARHAQAVLKPRRFVFASSTSVYAQTDGSIVTENSPAEPPRETGRVLRETENFVLAHGGWVARLAGIYGPGRCAMLQKLLEGRALIEGNGHRWLNQIHADDAASALFFLLKNDAPPGIYNVADDTPSRQIDCYQLLADQLGKPLPPVGPIDLDRKRGWTNKRVSNAKLRKLGWSPRFPSLAAALPEIRSSARRV